MIALLAITGLAIDGGGMFLLQRDAQNAADAAIQAATYAQCTQGDMDDIIQAGREAAAKNGFVHGEDNRTVEVNQPPTAGPRAGDSDYVEVVITAEKPKYFIQVVYDGPMQVTVRGVGRCNNWSEIFSSYAIMAFSDNCGWSVDISGSDTDITGGAYSNDGFKSTGSDTDITGNVEYAGDIHESTSTQTDFDPSVNNPTDTNNPLDPESFPLLYNVADFAPGGRVWNLLADSDKKSFVSGSTGITQLKNIELRGLYYIDGNVQLNNVEVSGDGATIVATGYIDVLTNVDNVTFKSFFGVEGSQGPSTNLAKGLVMLSAKDTTNCGTTGGIHFSGKKNDIIGVLYAPYGPVTLSGSQNDVCGALIGETVQVSGSENNIELCNNFPAPPPNIQYDS
jgi:hypothetical protein